MTGVPTVPLGSNLSFTNLDGSVDLPHGHLLRLPLPRPDERQLPAGGRQDEPGPRRSTSTRPSSASARPTSGRPRDESDWDLPVTREEGYKPGEIVTYFCRIHPGMRGAFEVTGVIRWSRSWPKQHEGLPVDVLPASNEEYFPPPPTREQMAIMRLANAETERLRRKFGMTRAQFVRTAAATAIGFWAIDAVRMGKYGNYGFAQGTRPGRLRPRVGPPRRAPRACATGPGSSSSTSSRTTWTRTALWRVSQPGDPRVLRRPSGRRPARAATSTRSRT